MIDAWFSISLITASSVLRIVSNRKAVSYPETVVRPKRESNSILFDRENSKKEKKFFWRLIGDSETEKIESLKELIKMRSRPALRWAIGLLRDSSPNVRSLAAQVLSEAEYTPAIRDIKTALKTEKDPGCLKELKKGLSRLKQIVNN